MLGKFEVWRGKFGEGSLKKEVWRGKFPHFKLQTPNSLAFWPACS
jgi:hypothetical protein